MKYYFVKTRKLEPRLVSVKCSDVMSLLKEKGLNLSKRMLAYKREVKIKGANSGGK